MTTPSKRRGDQGERDVAAILNHLLGTNVRRKLGAGRQDDQGDIDGLTDTCVEIKDYADTRDAISKGLDDLAREQLNAGTTFGVLFVKRRRSRDGHRWVAVMSMEQFAALWREATA